MNAFMTALQTKSAEIKKTTVKATPKVEVEPVPTVPSREIPRLSEEKQAYVETLLRPALTESPSPIFDFSGEAFEKYRGEVDRLCEHYRCDKADLAVIAVMHLGRLDGRVIAVKIGGRGHE